MTKNYKNSETITLRCRIFRKNKFQASITVPIHQTTSFQLNSTDHSSNLFSLKEFGNIYTRVMNPTTNVLEKSLFQLERGIGPLCVSSGQAATTFAIQNLCNYGDNTATLTDFYGDIINLFNNTSNLWVLKLDMISLQIQKIF